MSREYRGYVITEEGPGDWAIRYSSGTIMTRCGTSWSCICYIDELLSP